MISWDDCAGEGHGGRDENMVIDREFIDACAGRRPVDLLLKGVKWLDVFTGIFREGSWGVQGGRFTGPGDYRARKVLDLRGLYLVPGFIDAHCHLESTMLMPWEFARAVIPRGTTSIVADPHEIANVLGVQGILYLAKEARKAPMRFFFTLPSCVPASPLETSGARLEAEDLELLAREEWVAGLGEVMNFPGVVGGDPGVHRKLESFSRRAIDGHAPGLRGLALNAYVASNIRSDHECTALDEAREKLSLGMWIMIREGSTARNLEELLPLVNERTCPRCMFVTDDRTPESLEKEGHLDSILNRAMELGLDPVLAFRMVTLNPASYFGMTNLGAIAPGYLADGVILNSIRPLKIWGVLIRGELVWSEKRGFLRREKPPMAEPPSSFNVGNVGIEALRIPAKGRRMRVIEVVPGQIITRQTWAKPLLKGDHVVSDPSRDIFKIFVVERHKGTGNVGAGFVRGFGLKEGALASSVAHDSHNVVVVGVEDRDILAALNEVISMRGGLVVIKNGRVLERLPLPVAGLISPWPLERVVRRHEKLLRAARQLGCSLADPFVVLSFLALPVIPELKVTDLGLVDVRGFRKVSLFKE